MTVVNPKSISGINSITTGSGSDNLLTIHTSDASSTERIRINSSGDVIVGSGITVSPDGDIFATGVTTATTFSGSGASLTNLPAANLTGTLPAISGANLTNLDASDLASGTVPTARLGSGTASSSTFLRGDSTFAAVTSTTINSNTNNYLITGTGTADTLQGESALTFDGNDLTLQSRYFYIKAPDGGYRYFFGETENAKSAQLSLYDTTDTQKVRIAAGDGSSDATSFFTGGNLLVGSNSSAGSGYKLESYSGGAYNILAKSTNGNGGYHNFTGQASNGTVTSYISHNGRGYFEDGVQFDSSGEVLNSYETGNFTPTVNAIASANYTVQAGRYTKIGNLVTAQAYLLMASGGGEGSAFSIGSLPFTATNTTYKEGGGFIIYESGFFDNSSSVSPKNTCTVWVPANNTIIQFHKRYNGSAIYGNDTSFGTGANNVYLVVQVCYVAA